MSNEVEEIIETPDELMRELLRAERDQEITQTATMQGQIISLVVLLRDKGILEQADVKFWEDQAIEVSEMLMAMTRAMDTCDSEDNEDPEKQVRAMLSGSEATLRLMRLTGNVDGDKLKELESHRDSLMIALRELEQK